MTTAARECGQSRGVISIYYLSIWGGRLLEEDFFFFSFSSQKCSPKESLEIGNDCIVWDGKAPGTKPNGKF